MSLARKDTLEALLRARHLDRTLPAPWTGALPQTTPADEYAAAATGVATLDARLAGGLPRGQLSELIGPRSSGRTSVLMQTLAAATRRGELAALIDVLDMFDATSAVAAGVDLDRLLWIRGHVVANPGLCRDLNGRAVDQAIKAFTLVLQAGNFGVVAFDVSEAPLDALRHLPFTTWLRLQRIVEGSQTAALLVGAHAMARSSAGLTVQLDLANPKSQIPNPKSESPTPKAQSLEPKAQRFVGRLFEGLTGEARVVRARARYHEDVRIDFSTSCA